MGRIFGKLCFQIIFLVALPSWAFSQSLWVLSEEQAYRQWAQFLDPYLERNVVEFQPFRAEALGELSGSTPFKLISLNPHINTWFILETGEGRRKSQWHLENIAPDLFEVSIGSSGQGLVVESPEETTVCQSLLSELESARNSGLPYAPVCNGRLFLRNQGTGSVGTRERIVGFLRDYIPFGEDIINMVKDTFYVDAFRETSELYNSLEAATMVSYLRGAYLADRYQTSFLSVRRRAMVLEGVEEGRLLAGQWYPLRDVPGIYTSVVQSGMIHPEILNRPNETNDLDAQERWADVYLFGYDLTRFELRYAVGTDHPAVNWSPRPGVSHRGLPGPDGFATIDPLKATGMLNPVHLDRIAGIFVGGFKRQHGAFRYGDLSSTNSGHHYGIIINGVVLSRLQPGLATIYVLDDGRVQMGTWTEAHNQLLPRIRFARQNGVPLLETVEGSTRAGQFVTNWGPGNWSGSAEAQLRTLRSGACLREVEGRPFLIFAVFSTATPSGMTRVFQSYGCQYAMLLDMNSYELTYAAVYGHRADQENVDLYHLYPEMAGSDRDGRGRFIHFPDNRDFIYLLRTR